MFRRRTAVIAVLALTLGASLSACGGSGDEGASASPTISLPASAMETTAAQAEMPGADAGTWSPILIKKKTKSIELVPGQIAIFPALVYSLNPHFVAIAADPAIVEILDADKDSAVAIRAVAVGDTTVKIYQGTAEGGQGKYLRKVKVHVTDQ